MHFCPLPAPLFPPRYECACFVFLCLSLVVFLCLSLVVFLCLSLVVFLCLSLHTNSYSVGAHGFLMGPDGRPDILVGPDGRAVRMEKKWTALFVFIFEKHSAPSHVAPPPSSLARKHAQMLPGELNGAPAGYSPGKDGILEDAHGHVLVGTDGVPLTALGQGGIPAGYRVNLHGFLVSRSVAPLAIQKFWGFLLFRWLILVVTANLLSEHDGRWTSRIAPCAAATGGRWLWMGWAECPTAFVLIKTVSSSFKIQRLKQSAPTARFVSPPPSPPCAPHFLPKQPR